MLLARAAWVAVIGATYLCIIVTPGEIQEVMDSVEWVSHSSVSNSLSQSLINHTVFKCQRYPCFVDESVMLLLSGASLYAAPGALCYFWTNGHVEMPRAS